MIGPGVRGALLLALALTSAACAREEPRGVPDSEVAAVLEALASSDEGAVDAAATTVEAAADTRFVAPLIELLRASQLGAAPSGGYNRRVIALERLTGQSSGGDWLAWAGWYAGTDLVPVPGFAGFKGALFSAFDPEFAEWLDDDALSLLRTEEIYWGGVPIGGIPALDAPAVIPAADADMFDEVEPVVGVEFAGEARAYPLRILDWHELVNDTVGGVPIALTWCSLCGSAIAFDRRVGERTLRFDTSGLLYESNKLMFDLETRTLWRQLTGRAVVGRLARDDARLDVYPSVVTTFGSWRARHPDSTVLSLDTGHERLYEPGNPYGAYYAGKDTLFPLAGVRDDLPKKERVFGMDHDGQSVAWPVADLAAERVRNDSVGGLDVVLVATEGVIEVAGRSEIAGPVHYDAGGAVRAYARGERRFEVTDDAALLRDERGREWRLTEAALLGPEGERAERVAGTFAYWFAWQAVHPDSGVRRAGPER